jgi:hypothetical protein
MALIQGLQASTHYNKSIKALKPKFNPHSSYPIQDSRVGYSESERNLLWKFQ